MNGLGVALVVVAIALGLVALVRIADREVTLWRADRDEVRRAQRAYRHGVSHVIGEER